MVTFQDYVEGIRVRKQQILVCRDEEKRKQLQKIVIHLFQNCYELFGKVPKVEELAN